MSVMPASSITSASPSFRDRNSRRATRDLTFGQLRNLVCLRMRAQQELMLTAVSGHARQIAFHHVEVDDDCGSFEFGNDA